VSASLYRSPSSSPVHRVKNGFPFQVMRKRPSPVHPRLGKPALPFSLPLKGVGGRSYFLGSNRAAFPRSPFQLNPGHPQGFPCWKATRTRARKSEETGLSLGGSPSRFVLFLNAFSWPPLLPMYQRWACPPGELLDRCLRTPSALPFCNRPSF